MAHPNPSSMPEGVLVSVAEPMIDEAAERSELLQTQLKSSARLTEYYNQVVAEIRASLEQIGEDVQAS